MVTRYLKILLTLGLLFIAMNTHAANLISNPGFDADGTGWGAMGNVSF